jgi:RimJ/RimL family protein N-acetyltransferase
MRDVPPKVMLRDVIESDLPIFLAHQLDPRATAMAAFPAREGDAHFAHWTKIMADGTNILKTILADEQVAGNIVSWDASGQREVGYWLGREFWGQGIATRALELFLGEVATRPLYAHVVRHNRASRRVLEKCGFIVIGADGVLPENATEPVAEFVLRLD